METIEFLKVLAILAVVGLLVYFTYKSSDELLADEPEALYYVFNPKKDKPVYVHTSYESALKEAERLLKKEPESSFEILRIEAIVTNHPDEYIPF